MKANIIQNLIGFVLLSFSTIAASDPIVEWAPFEVKSGISDDRIVRAAQAVEDGFLSKQPGYIKRSLLKGANDQWVDIVYWHSEEDAQSAANNAMASPVCFEYFALMKQSDHAEVSNVLHYSVVKSWP